MKRLAAGDDAALNDLMDRHGQRLFHYLTRHLANEADAEDCAQDAFVKVYLHRTKFVPTAKFSSWLYTIAINGARNMRRGRKPEVSLDAEREDGIAPVELTDVAASAPDQLLLREKAEEVRRAVQALPEQLRTPLLLFEFEDLPQSEIAVILECSPKAVEVRIYRARQMLREALNISDRVTT
jgi:RNA polymerase sigma-70 factor, ECF subfamily